MIDDAFVIDAVVHAYNQTPANFALPVAATAMTEMAYLLAKDSPDPDYELPRDVYLSDWSIDDLATLLFRESNTDVAVFHHLNFASFKDGYSSLEKAAEALEKYPNRFIGAYAFVDPLHGRKALEDMERQVETLKPLGLKLYPTSWQGEDSVSWRMDDPKLVYPLYYKAAELGLRHVAIHKAVPIGPFPVGDAYDPSDLENAATTFPELTFEIVHGGLAFIEETAWLLARFGNIYVNMEIQNIVVERRPLTFSDILIRMCHVGGNAMLDRLFWGSGGTLVHPRPGLEAFMQFEFPEDKLENAGLFAAVKQITHEDKLNMLGRTYARLHGIDIEACKRAIEGDQFSPNGTSGLAEPYTTNSKADQVQRERAASHA
jgi:predicted TIM-barrel fold metal-dependent hydrolase